MTSRNFIDFSTYYMMCILMTMNGDGKINSNDDAAATF